MARRPRVIKSAGPIIEVDFWWADQERLRVFREELLEDLIRQHSNTPYELASFLRKHPVAGKHVKWSSETIYRLSRLGLPQKSKERVYSGTWTKDLENVLGAIAPFLGTGHTMESIRAFLSGKPLEEVEKIYQETKNKQLSLEERTAIGDKLPLVIRGNRKIMPSETGVLEFSRSLRSAVNKSPYALKEIAACCGISMARLQELCERPETISPPTPNEINGIDACEMIELKSKSGAIYTFDDLVYLVYPEIRESDLRYCLEGSDREQVDLPSSPRTRRLRI